jgi:hypothetical protein
MAGHKVESSMTNRGVERRLDQSELVEQAVEFRYVTPDLSLTHCRARPLCRSNLARFLCGQLLAKAFLGEDMGELGPENARDNE